MKDVNICGRYFDVLSVDSTRNSTGRIDKVWLRDRENGADYIAKGSSFLSYEPLSEALAYVIGKSIGIDVAEVILVRQRDVKNIRLKSISMCPFISLCKSVNTNNKQVVTVAHEKYRLNNSLGTNYKNRDVMEMCMKKEWIDRMLFFDALIGNKDRHYRNIHILKDVITGEYYECPLIDNGDSLLATDVLQGTSIGTNIALLFNKRVPLAKNHDKQLEYITTIDLRGISISSVLESVHRNIGQLLSLVGVGRASQIIKYINTRFRKYYSSFGAE